MSDAPELRPCPFCGGEAKVVPDREGFGGFIGCMNLAGCFMPYRRFDKRKGPNREIQGWNTRADLAQAELQAAVEAERYACGKIADEASDWTDHPGDVAKAIRARGNTDALEAAKAEARAEARRVKPLEWVEDGVGFWGNGLFTYVIRPGGEGYFWFRRNGTGSNILPDKPGIEAAKAAAQADYERRILSALIPTNGEDG